MNRKIKFRGKDFAIGEWVYGDLLHPITSCRIVNYTEFEEEGAKRADYHYFDVDPGTIGQFTGLHDSNGNEIYEGDILDCSAVKTIMLEVRYNPKQAAFCLAEHTHAEGVILGTTPLGEMLRHYPDMHIIGNIHDNPELLKGE